MSVSALAASGLALAAPAAADPANPTPVSGTALPTAQVNGVVWAQTVANGIDYAGGSFSQSQPAGAAAGVDVTARSNVFAYNVSTGAAVAGFNATTNAQVRGIAASADGSRIYIVGDFTTVNGQPRSHIAALDAAGNLVGAFAPSVNGNVYAVTTRGDEVFFGGSFTAVGGQARSRAASVTTLGSLLPFAPVPNDGVVRAVALSPDGAKVLLGGSFTGIGAVGDRGMAAVDATTGTSMSWGANSLISDAGTGSAIYSLSTRGSVVYATGYVYTGGGNLEGSVAMNWGDGSIVWIEDCLGDSYSSVPFNDALYVVSHAHTCANVIGGWSSPGVATQWRRAQAFSQAATGVLAHDSQGGYVDFGGQPSPTLLSAWRPSINTGTYTGLNQGAWSAAAGGSYLVLGGEFTTVNGQRQTGLVRFQGSPESPDPALGTPQAPTPTPTESTTTPPADGAPAPAEGTTPGRVAKPDAVALGSTSVAVKWSAPKAAATDKVSGYVVTASKGSKVVKTVDLGKTKRLATISGLKRSTTYKIGVAAKNAEGTGKISVLDSVKTKARGKTLSAVKKPTKVAKPTASKGTARLRVHWKAASASGALPVSKYEVRVVLRGKTITTFVVDDRLRSKLSTGLKRNTAYTVSVRAGNWAGWGSWSTGKSARTR